MLKPQVGSVRCSSDDSGSGPNATWVRHKFNTCGELLPHNTMCPSALAEHTVLHLKNNYLVCSWWLCVCSERTPRTLHVVQKHVPPVHVSALLFPWYCIYSPVYHNLSLTRVVTWLKCQTEGTMRRAEKEEKGAERSHLSAKRRFSLSLSVCCLHYSKGHLIRRLELAFFTVCSMQWCSTLLHINSGVYFSSSLSIYWHMSSIDPRIDLLCNPLPICLLQWAFKWFVRLSY